MPWIRFSRNEALAPSLPLRDPTGQALDLHRFRADGPLVLFFAPSGGIASCPALLAALTAAPLHEHDAALLIVSDVAHDLDGAAAAVLGFDAAGELRSRYARLMEVESTGRPLIFLLDRDGSPVYAWVGACDESAGAAAELMRKLQSAAFLCPECSVPDPASSAMWDVIY